MKKQNLLICIDRDGTLTYDKEFHLGSQKNWKSKIKILPTVIQGIKLLNKSFPEARLFIITNQPGVAVKQLPLLTQKKAEQVCSEIIRLLKKKGAIIHGLEVCGHASKKYQNKRRENFTFYKKYICECSCIKPKPGMIFNALKKLNWRKKDTMVYVLGDRSTDIQAAHNAKGFGIIIPFKETSDQKPKLNKLKFRFHTAKNFLGAAKFIVRREK